MTPTLDWADETAGEHVRNALAMLDDVAATIPEFASAVIAAKDRLKKALDKLPGTSDIPRHDEVRFLEDVLRRARGPDLHAEAVAVARAFIAIHHMKGGNDARADH